MKKRILCLLLALAVVLSVLPLTAFAETEKVPEEFWGTYKATTEGTDYPVTIIISANRAYVDIPDEYWDHQFPYNSYTDLGKLIKLDFLDLDDYSALPLAIYLYKDPALGSNYADISSSALSFTFLNVEKVSDPTSSTLSAGSDLIIPIAAVVLLIGAVIFIGKRKKEITE